MDIHGLWAWRFHKRYYIRCSVDESYFDKLGAFNVSKIPQNHTDYVAWLEAERQKVGELAAEWDKRLTVEIDEQPCSDLGVGIPSWFPPIKKLWFQWVYIVDLDREVFTVNNCIHFKLEQAPHVNWTDGAVDGQWDREVLLASSIPEEAFTDLVAHPFASVLFAPGLPSRTLADPAPPLAYQIVKPKGISHIPWRRRYGPGLRWALFEAWSHKMKDNLEATLPQWSTQDFPFREIAFAILCLVSGGKNITMLPAERYKAQVQDTYGFFTSKNKVPTQIELVSNLASGAHVKGCWPGSAPQEMIYWHDGVLVVLVAQLYRPQAIEEGVAFVVSYCHHKHPKDVVDAVLVSIKHVVLIRINPNSIVQHTTLLPLFDISEDLTSNLRDRNPKLHANKQSGEGFGSSASENRKESVLPDRAAQRISVYHDIRATFFALAHFFDVVARRHLPTGNASTARLPKELTSQILSHVADIETHSNCMVVSTMFRDLCQEHVIFAKNMVFRPCKDEQWLGEQSESPPRLWNLNCVFSNAQLIISCQQKDRPSFGRQTCTKPSWLILIGAGFHKKSLLARVYVQMEQEHKQFRVTQVI